MSDPTDRASCRRSGRARRRARPAHLGAWKSEGVVTPSSSWGPPTTGSSCRHSTRLGSTFDASTTDDRGCAADRVMMIADAATRRHSSRGQFWHGTRSMLPPATSVLRMTTRGTPATSSKTIPCKSDSVRSIPTSSFWLRTVAVQPTRANCRHCESEAMEGSLLL